MDAFEAIMTRRSIRKYTDKPVSKDDIDDLLKAAMAAPSAVNTQPWHFIILDDHEIMDQIPDFHPHSTMLKTAAVGIAVCIDQTKEHAPGYGIQDCSAAIENILLAAHAKGLGAVWLGIYPREQRVDGLRRLLNIPDHILPLSVISVGFPAESKAPSERFDRKKIHYNRW